jgi:ATP-dependent DNA ligase
MNSVRSKSSSAANRRTAVARLNAILSRGAATFRSRPAKTPPAGSEWIHEIKHDGFRILARRDLKRVRLITRNGHDSTKRFPEDWGR